MSWTHGKRAWLLAPVVAFVTATVWADRQRPAERITSHEEIEDPAIGRAFGRIACWPQMRLLRKVVIDRALMMVRQGNALDVGCGPGHLVIEMAQRAPGLQVTGIDLAAEMLEQAAVNARRAGVYKRVGFKNGNASRLPFEDASFDLVLSTLSLHHWSQPEVVLSEIARVLRPGGAYLVFDLRRDMAAPAYTLLWFVTKFIVPKPLRRINEPLSSCHAAYTLGEAAELAERTLLTDWRIIPGPVWLFLEGRQTGRQS